MAQGRQVGEVVGALMRELSARHHIVGWGFSHGEDMGGTELEIELLNEDEDMAVRRSLTELWKVPKSYAGQCRTLTLTLNDGSTHTASFRFR